MLISKAQQEQEATNRANAGLTPQQIAAGADPEQVRVAAAQEQPDAPIIDSPMADELPVERGRKAADTEPTEPVRQPTKQGSPHDKNRNDIISRLRARRVQETADDDESDAQQINRFARSGMPPELLGLAAQGDVPTPAAEASQEQVSEEEPEPAAPPAKRKLKVRGQEVELTEDEVVAAAQKFLAADNYLDEAKSKMEEVNRLLAGARQTQPTARSDQPTTPQGARQNATQSADPDEDLAPAVADTPDPYVELAEKIQFGDSADAAKSLATLVTMEAGRQSEKALLDQRMRSDALQSQRIVQKFSEEHPELAKDEFASAAMEKHLYRLQVEDMAKFWSPEEIPQTPADVARWHQYCRAQGLEVRDVGTLLTTARDNFLAWKGTPATPQTSAASSGAPKIAVNVDRAARRAAVPLQPTRTVTARPDSVSAPPSTQTRSDIVKQMMNQRSKPRGQVLPA